jgi:hypothetical protein
MRRENPCERANTYVCSTHFAPDCFEPNADVISGFKKYKTLKQPAVPTLLGHAYGASGVPCLGLVYM